MESHRTIANPVPTSAGVDHVGGTTSIRTTDSSRPVLLSVSLVSRSRLLEMIDRTGLEPITTVVAPTGYGKSTLVAQWVAQSRNRTCWVSLTPGDNSVDRFLEHLRHATQCDLPIARPLPDNSLAVIIALLDAGATLSSDVVIVLDDVHLIENPSIHDLLNALVRHLPPRLHLVLLSRTIPPVNLGRVRMQGHLREITQTDLAFTPDEAVQFFAGSQRHTLSPDQGIAIAELTEGWIAGMKLAAISIQQHPVQHQGVIGRLWDSRVLDDYIFEEVLAHLPDELRTFVLGTAGLPFLNPDLCNAVLNMEDASTFINEIRLRVVFVIPLDETGQFLRYHHLFGESVDRIAARTLPSDERRRQCQRASVWFSERGEREQAIECAILARDWSLAVPLMTAICKEMADRDQAHSLLHWVRKLPHSVIQAHHHLSYWQIFMLFCIGEGEHARTLFGEFESSWRESGDLLQEAHADACAGMVATQAGDVDTLLELSYRCLNLYPSTCTVERFHALTGVIEGEFGRGNDEAVDKALAEAVAVRATLPADQRWASIHFDLLRPNHLALRGDLTGAEQIYRHMLTTLTGPLRLQAGKLRYRLAVIALERNDMREAVTQANLIGLSDDSEPDRYYWYPEAVLACVRVFWEQGDHLEAKRLLEYVYRDAERAEARQYVARANVQRASMWIEQGELALARRWADQADLSSAGWSRVFGELDARLVRARLYLAEHNPRGALALLQVVVDEAVVTRRHAELVRAYTHTAIARAMLADMPGAAAELSKAIRWGKHGRFLRSFVIPNHDLLPVFQYLDRGLRDSDYVQQLETTLRTVSPDISRAYVSERERDVLELAASGFTNQRIADRLFISELTVKKHLANINKKLKTRNRVEALNRARELGVI